MERRMRDGLKRFPWLVYSREGALEGYVYGSPFRSRPAYRWSVEASVYLTEDAVRRGIGTALGIALDTFFREQGFVNVFGVVTLPNPASVGLMESLGMKKAGVWEDVGYKRGSWHDVGVWQRRINKPSDNPPTPIPFDDLKQNLIDRALLRGEARLRT